MKGGLACQTVVTDGMAVAMIPFVPAEKPIYDLNELEADVSTFTKLFPTVFRCVSCNTCTKACPQEIQVMDYIQAALKGDYKQVTELSFECIQCGLCAIRCPAEIVQYHAAQFGRRMYARHGRPAEENAVKRTEEVNNREFDKKFTEVMDMSEEEFRKVYTDQQSNREIY